MVKQVDALMAVARVVREMGPIPLEYVCQMLESLIGYEKCEDLIWRLEEARLVDISKDQIVKWLGPVLNEEIISVRKS